MAKRSASWRLLTGAAEQTTDSSIGLTLKIAALGNVPDMF
jgi:hypothetical protein